MCNVCTDTHHIPRAMSEQTRTTNMCFLHHVQCLYHCTYHIPHAMSEQTRTTIMCFLYHVQCLYHGTYHIPRAMSEQTRTTNVCFLCHVQCLNHCTMACSTCHVLCTQIGSCDLFSSPFQCIACTCVWHCTYSHPFCALFGSAVAQLVMVLRADSKCLCCIT